MMSGGVALPGQLDLIAKVDIERHARKKSGLPVSYLALRRAKGMLELLPAQMLPASVNEGVDGSVEFTWERHDLDGDIVLRLCAMPHGGVRYWYSVTTPKEKGQAGGHLKAHQPDDHVIGIVRGVVALLTPKQFRSTPSGSAGELQ
jgi:hypothetical protein